MSELLGQDPSDDSPGSVTLALRRIGAGTDRDDDLFRAVAAQLTEKASRVLRAFPRLRGQVDPDDLVNDFVRLLLVKLAPADIRSRQQFFALACRNFRWILLDQLGQAQGSDLPGTLADSATGPATAAARTDEHRRVLELLERAVPERDRKIFELRALLGLTYQEIADELGMPRATVALRFQEVRKQLLEGLEAAPGELS